MNRKVLSAIGIMIMFFAILMFSSCASSGNVSRNNAMNSYCESSRNSKPPKPVKQQKRPAAATPIGGNYNR